MSRYMLRLVDQDLAEFIRSLSWKCTAAVGNLLGYEHVKYRLYQAVFDAIVEYLRPCLHAYAACGTARGCDSELEETPLVPQGGTERRREISPRSDRIQRYHLELHVPLEDFVRRLEGAILREIGRKVAGFRWRAALYQELAALRGKRTVGGAPQRPEAAEQLRALGYHD